MLADECESQASGSPLSLRIVSSAKHGEELAKLSADPDDHIAGIKEAIATKLGAATTAVWLLYGGQLLEDGMTLRESGLPCGEGSPAGEVEVEAVEDIYPPGFPEHLKRAVSRCQRQRQQRAAPVVPGRLRREPCDRSSRKAIAEAVEPKPLQRHGRGPFCHCGAGVKVSEPVPVVRTATARAPASRGGA